MAPARSPPYSSSSEAHAELAGGQGYGSILSKNKQYRSPTVPTSTPHSHQRFASRMITREQMVGLLASSTSGVLARFPCHPLDTCKARLQVQGSTPRYTSLLDTMRQTFRAEGLRGLYRGFGVTVVGSAPATCLYLTSYDASKQVLNENFFKGNDFLAHFTAGMLAEIFSCVLWVPIDVTKERLQIQEGCVQQSQQHHERRGMTTNYRGSYDALRTIVRTEGLRGIYKGYGATVASFGPFSAFYFMFYEQIKKTTMSTYYGEEKEKKEKKEKRKKRKKSGGVDLEEMDHHQRDPPFWLHMLNSSTASMLASFVTNPLDLVKLRLQVQRSGGRQIASKEEGAVLIHTWGTYTGMIDGLRQIVANEGMVGLFRGVGARMAFHGPSMAITIACYEKLRVIYDGAL